MCAITRSCAAAAADMPAGRRRERPDRPRGGRAFSFLMQPVFFSQEGPAHFSHGEPHSPHGSLLTARFTRLTASFTRLTGGGAASRTSLPLPSHPFRSDPEPSFFSPPGALFEDATSASFVSDPGATQDGFSLRRSKSTPHASARAP